MRTLSRVLAWLRRPRVWLPLLVLAVAVSAGLYFAGPYVWGGFSWRAAERALAERRPREAQRHIECCLRVWPQSAEVHLRAARVARLGEDYDAAERHLLECQRLEGKESDDSVFEWALLRAEGGDMGPEGFLLAQVENNPSRAEAALEALAAGHLSLYRFYQALRCLETCLERNPKNLRALYLRGKAWERVHAHPKAAADYQQVVEQDPEQEEARLRLAHCRLETGEPALAAAQLEHLRRARPDDPEVLVPLAFAWNALGKLPQGLELIDEVLAKHPGLQSALSARGQLLFQADRPAEAEVWLRKAIAAKPFDRPAHYVLQQSLERQNKIAEAAAQRQQLTRVEETINRLLTIANKLMPMKPHDPALHHELGTIFMRMGNEELGLVWLKSALREDAEYRPAHRSLVDYYERRDNAAQAAWHRQRAGGGPQP